MADEEFDAPMSDVRLELDVAKLQRYLDSTVPELGSSSNLRSGRARIDDGRGAITCIDDGRGAIGFVSNGLGATIDDGRFEYVTIWPIDDGRFDYVTIWRRINDCHLV